MIDIPFLKAIKNVEALYNPEELMKIKDQINDIYEKLDELKKQNQELSDYLYEDGNDDW